MASFTKSDFQRIAVSALGALTVSSACILGAVGPVHAAAPLAVPVTTAAWQETVERRLDEASADESERFSPSVSRHAEVALHFTADGDFAGASLARSCGSRALDQRAVGLARQLSYPKLPEAMRGQPRDVTMRLAFGSGAAPATERASRLAEQARHGTELAAR